MGLPETLRVKLSSENAGYLSIMPVVTREMPLRELVELMLDVTGKSVERVRELLARGALVSGATRYRWEGLEADPEDLRRLLSGFPDPEPERPFAAARCVRVVLIGPHCRIEITREAGARRRLLRQTSFWDVLLALVADVAPQYREYSYKERADCYRLKIAAGDAERLRNHAHLLRYSILQERVRTARFDHVDFFVARA